jgi:hypothetical protein
MEKSLSGLMPVGNSDASCADFLLRGFADVLSTGP